MRGRNQKMKRPVLTTKRQVMRAVISHYKGGRACAALRLGYELKKFDNHLYENAGSRPLSDEQIHQLEQDAGTAHLPEYIAAMYGGIFVPLAKPESLDNVDLYRRAVSAREISSQLLSNKRLVRRCQCISSICISAGSRGD